MVTLGIVLIHNNDADRFRTASAAIEQFKTVADKHFTVVVDEESYQEKIVPAGWFTALLAWFLSCRLEHRWKLYVNPSATSAERRGFRRTSRWWCRKNLRRLPRRRRRVSVAAALTAKNIRAWKKALDHNWDCLLVLEDDVVVSRAFEAEATQVCEAVSSHPPEVPLFVSIAQALTLDELGVTHLIKPPADETTSGSSSLLWFTRPVSNSAAAYLINKESLRRFHAEVTRHPPLRRIIADWLLNALFVRLHKNNEQLTCFHGRQGIFVNRSILGQLPSQTQI